MKTIRVTNAAMTVFFMTVGAHSQNVQEPTRFTIVAAPILSQPKGDFRLNVGSGFGGGGGLLYRLDQQGLLNLRFDFSGVAYGREKKQVPLSETVGGRVLVN